MNIFHRLILKFYLTSIEVAEGRNHYPDNVCIPSTGVYKRVDTKKITCRRKESVEEKNMSKKRTCRRKERVEENDVSKKKTTSFQMIQCQETMLQKLNK